MAYTSRRMSSIAVVVSARSCLRSASAASGSVRTRLRTASEVNAMPERRGPSPSWRSRLSLRRSSSRAVMVASRDSWRSAARARARRVCASNGAASRSTCWSLLLRDRSPGRSPTTSSAPAPSRGKVRVWVSEVPDSTSTPPSDRSAAYGSTSASRITRSAWAGSSPTCPASRLAASSGSGRRPKSSSSTTPRSITWRGWKPAAASTATTASSPTAGTSPPTISSTAAAPANTEM